MKFALIIVASVAAGTCVFKGANGALGSAGVSAGVSADAGGNVGAEGSAEGSVDGGGTAGGSMDVGGSAGGSMDVGGSAAGSIDVGGCASVQGGISGDASASGQTNGDASGSAQGGLQGDASLNGCGCAAQGGIGASGSANVDAGGQEISANGDASVNWPDNGCGGSAEATSAQAGHTYDIQVKKTQSVSYNNKVVNTQRSFHDYDSMLAEIGIIFKEPADVDHPFYIDGTLKKGKTDLYTIDRNSPISSCGEYQDGTWEYVLVETFNAAISAGHDCSAEKGNYTIYKDFTVQATFEDTVDCGDYDIHIYVDNSYREWSFEFAFVLTIAEDCNS